VSSADIVDEKGKKIGVRYVPEGYTDAAESFEMLLDEDFITACSALIPKSILDEVGLLNENLVGNDDHELWLRITKKYGIFGISESLCAWRKSEKSFSKDMSRIFIENEKIFDVLKSENRVEKELIENGKNKNLFRLFIAYVKEKKYDDAKKVLGRARQSQDLSQRLAIKVFLLSPGLAHFSLAFVRGFTKNKK
jgi:hypothetical protein